MTLRQIFPDNQWDNNFKRKKKYLQFSYFLGFHEAAEQCKSQSGGHLVAFENDDEFENLKQFLGQHVVENIRNKFSQLYIYNLKFSSTLKLTLF